MLLGVTLVADELAINTMVTGIAVATGLLDSVAVVLLVLIMVRVIL